MIAIRAARPDDAGAIAAIYAPFVTDGVVSFETEPPDEPTMRARMTAGDGLYPWLVATAPDDGVLGYAYASRFHDRAAYRHVVESTIYLADDARGKGIGRALYAALLATLTDQGFTQAIGRIALPNPASIALHEALGFRASGLYRAVGYKRGAWIDVGTWQRALAECAVPPAEPMRFADLGVVRG